MVDYDSATGIPIDQAIQNQVTKTLFDRMEQDYKQTNPEGFENLNNQTVLGNQYVRDTLPVYVGTQRRSKIFKIIQSGAWSCDDGITGISFK